MFYIKKISAIIMVLIVSGLYALETGDPAPEFTIYHYKDKTFSTDTVYGEKVVAFIFGSIT